MSAPPEPSATTPAADVPSYPVFAEAERELDAVCAKFSGQPRRLLVRLFLMALEREELVSIGYRDSLMAPRLKAMPLEENVRQVIRHALIWTWKDEEMHSLYIRGAIFKLGSAPLRLRAIASQAAGAVGGWASAALQHTRWSQAPLSRFLAAVITTAAGMLGKLPKEIQEKLRFGPFRDFCLFNAELEMASRLSWERIVELSCKEPDLKSDAIRDFQRVVDDEERHRQIFNVLAEALDDQDRLRISPESLCENIRAVGTSYLPRKQRRVDDIENPVGSGNRVWCLQGGTAEEKVPLFRRLLEDAELPMQLENRARFLGKKVSELSIAIKPTFMLGYHHKDLSPVTDFQFVETLASFLRQQGCRDVCVVEGPNIYDRFFRNRTVSQVADYLGFRSPHFRVVDVGEEQVPHDYARGMAQHTISRTWKEADFRISFGKVRSHPIEIASLSILNLEGLGSRADEFIFFERQASRTTSLMMLLDHFPPHFALLEGYDLAPDGLVGMMGCPRPKTPRRLYAGADALAVDIVVSRHLGIAHPGQSGVLQAAYHWFGSWSEQAQVIGVNDPIADWRGPYSNELWTLMSLMALPMYVFGSGRGLRFVPEMDEQAFPPIQPSSWFLRFRRRNIRALIGLHHRSG